MRLQKILAAVFLCLVPIVIIPSAAFAQIPCELQFPPVVGPVDTPGEGLDIAVSGSYAYIADGDSGLQIMDISDPSAPYIEGATATSGSAYGVAVSGSFAYVLDNSVGLQIVNVSNPSAPSAAGSVTTPGDANDIAMSGSYAFIADGASDLQIIDISDPFAPEIVSSVVFPIHHPLGADYFAFGVAVADSYAYIATGNDTIPNYGGCLEIVDISDPASAYLAASFDTQQFFVHDVSVLGSNAYITLGGCNSYIRSVDISNPLAPTWAYPTSCGFILMDAAGSVAMSDFVGYHQHGAGLQIFDPFVPSPFSFMTTLGTIFPPGNAIAASGSYGYIIDDSGLRVVDASLPCWPREIGYCYYLDDILSGITVSGFHAYVSEGNAGLQVVDVSDPGSPHIVSSVDTPDSAADVAVSGSFAYVADGLSGLQVVDVSDPGSPDIVGSVDTPDSAADVAVSGSFAYVADGLSGLQVVDVSDPAFPDIVASIDTPGDARTVAVSGSTACVADWDSGLQVVDVSDPLDPGIVGSVPMPGMYGYAWDVATSGSHAYVAFGPSGLHIIDISNPSAPDTLSSIDVPGDARTVSVSDSYAFVGTSIQNIQIIDVFDPSSPYLTGTLTVCAIGKPLAAVSDSYVYVPSDGGQGLTTIQLCKGEAPVISRSPISLSNVCLEGDDASDQSFEVRNIEGGTLSYTISDDADWLSCSPSSGDSTGEADSITVIYTTASLAAKNYTATITITDASASNSPLSVPVELEVTPLPQELTQINLVSPANESTASSAPTFTWTVDGGADNRYKVDFRIPGLVQLWSTPPLMENSWDMPTPIWNKIPHGRRVYWRVRGADMDVTPRNIITSDEIWYFDKP